MRSWLEVVAGAVLIAGLGAACSEAPWPRVVPEPAPQAARGGVAAAAGDAVTVDAGAGERAPSVAAVTVSAEAKAALDKVLAAYDTLHGALVKDSLDGVAETAAKLAEAARTARTVVGDATLEARLTEIEARARGLGGADLEATRTAFGEVSKALVPLVSAVAELREGRRVFLCPMAHGYQKWIQREPSLRNPYFGSKMLTCGEESDWGP